jgi:hypothetical protein
MLDGGVTLGIELGMLDGGVTLGIAVGMLAGGVTLGIELGFLELLALVGSELDIKLGWELGTTGVPGEEVGRSEQLSLLLLVLGALVAPVFVGL